MKYPSRARPDLFKKRVLEWRDMSSGTNDLIFICTADKDDKSMNNDDIKQFCVENDVNINYHDDNTKISACNKDIPTTGWDYLLLISDDMECIMRDWDLVVCDGFKNYGSGVIWFDDGLNHSIDTFIVITKEYYDRFGYLYNPEYKSVYCDNEFTIVAIKLGQIVKATQSIVKHNWVGLELKDELHIQNENRENYDRDSEVFKRRKEINFGI